MNTHVTSLGVGLLLAGALTAPAPAAAQVRVDYTCKVESFNSFLQIPPGTVLSGYFVYVTTATDLDPGDPTAGRYNQNLIDAQAGGAVTGSFSPVTSGLNNTFIGDNFVPGSPSGRDQINLSAPMVTSAPINGWSLTWLLLTLTDSTKTVFQDDTLANKTAFALSQFDGKIGTSSGFNRVQYTFSNGVSSTGFQCAITSAQAAMPDAAQADAGPDQTVDEDTGVTLDGSGSSGSGLSYQWSQIAGPAVTLSGADTAYPTFTAPLLPGGFGGAQTLTFALTVSNTGGSHTDSVNVQVVNVNHAPEAHADGPAAVAEGSPVTLAGGDSFDPDGDALTYAWTQLEGPLVTLAGADTAAPSFDAPVVPGGLGAGETLRFELTVSDGVLSDVAAVTVLVEQDNHAPVASATASPTMVNSGDTVTLNGNASSDPDGDPLSYAWTQTSGPPVGLADSTAAVTSFMAPAVGGPTLLTFRLTVHDSALPSAPASVAVTVVRPNDPPVCGAAKASPASLWPPNHSLHAITIIGVTDPENDTVPITVTGVTQDEPVNGLGDGDTSPDAVTDGSSVLVRAERSGGGNGRVYAVHFTATDAEGATCSGVVQVSVPHSNKRGTVAVDDGQLYDSRQP